MNIFLFPEALAIGKQTTLEILPTFHRHHRHSVSAFQNGSWFTRRVFARSVHEKGMKVGNRQPKLVRHHKVTNVTFVSWPWYEGNGEGKQRRKGKSVTEGKKRGKMRKTRVRERGEIEDNVKKVLYSLNRNFSTISYTLESLLLSIVDGIENNCFEIPLWIVW